MRSKMKRSAGALAIGALAMAMAACTTSNVGESGPGQSTTGGNPPAGPQADKIDLLLMIDNSASMADKQQILSAAVGDLVSWLANPPCIDDHGVPAAKIEQPQSASGLCPSSYHREFLPITDMHLGVIDSSLGGHGGDQCPDSTSSCPAGATNTTNNDHGHLVTRLDPCSGDMASSYDGKGFLAWDPAQKLQPPGEANAATVAQQLGDLVNGVGQIGCGLEAPLEGIYRFLADPAPYQSISVESNKAVLIGKDDVLLAQRKDFLRPDSLLMILMLSDENDCSIRDGGVNYLAASSQLTMFRARTECAQDPNDPCCASCGQVTPAGCPDDPSCEQMHLSSEEDALNLRCFENKRRFGIDFLYPTQRYVNALTQTVIDPSALDLAVAEGATGVPNPIFSDLNPDDDVREVRGSNLVVLAGLVGVPWQDVARDPSDLGKGFKTPTELQASGAWDAIVGDPDHYVRPTNPFMQESVTPRSGTDPITGESISLPGSNNPINGHEFTTAAIGDLQFACTFALAQPKDCTQDSSTCDCGSFLDPAGTSPLCAPNPNDNGNLTLQVRAKAYPGLRQLAVLKGMGDQAVVGSICPAQYTNPEAADYAYRPLVASLIAQAKKHLLPAN